MDLSLCVVLVSIIFILLICLLKSSHPGNIALIGVLINAGISSWVSVEALLGHSFRQILNGGSVFGDIPVRIDALSAWFILLMNFTMVTGILYGRRYMKYYENKPAIRLHFVCFLINHFTMIGIYSIQNSLLFLYVWELMALSSFVMIIFEYQRPETIKAGINFLIQSHICILFITLGLIWVSSHTGSYDFNSIGQYCNSVNPAISFSLYICFFIGFAIKAGFVPFHTWLPYAHPVAPSHISGVMSGVMIKLGIFGMFRMLLLVNHNYLIIGYIILVVSLISGVYGVILAIVQHNLKKLLAYHSIENIGIIGIGLGLGAIGTGLKNPYLAFAGFAGALLHILNHSLFKSILFYVSGTIYQATHTLNIDSMGGLIKKMPGTAISFLIAAAAICGLPPLNGFVSEFIIYLGLFEGIHSGSLAITTFFILSVLGLAVIGGLALLCFTKAFGIVFLGSERSKYENEIKEAEPSKLFPGYLILILIIAIGLFPQIFIKLLLSPVSLFTGGFSGDFTGLSIITTLQSVSLISWTFLIVLGIILSVHYFISRKGKDVAAPTWSCGYSSPNSKMQYTASSYVRTYRKLMQPLLQMNKKEEEIKGIFSGPIHSRTHPYDKIESVLIDFPLKLMNNFLARVRFIQTGNVRHYLLYGVVFIFTIVVFALAGDLVLYLINLLKQ